MNRVPLWALENTFFADVPRISDADGALIRGSFISIILAGIFLSLAMLSAGFYLIHKSRNEPASSSGKLFTFFSASLLFCALAVLIAFGLAVANGGTASTGAVVVAWVGAPITVSLFGVYYFRKPAPPAVRPDGRSTTGV